MLELYRKHIVEKLSALKSITSSLFHASSVQFRIEELSVINQQVTLQIVGKNAILKLKVIDAIEDLRIIQGVSPEDASFLGHCYAIGLLHSPTSITLTSKKHELYHLSSENCKYQIHCQLRTGQIQYIDVKTNRLLSAYPLDIVKNKNLISGFNPIQACHIGILSARKSDSSLPISKNHRTLSQSVPTLRLVK